MNDSETECDDDSNEELTPVMNTYQEKEFEKSCPSGGMSYLQSLTQLDSMLPPASQPAAAVLSYVTDGNCGKDGNSGKDHLNKRRSILMPPQATTPKAAVRPPLSEDRLRQEAIRILKTLPRGEATMWGIMQTIEYHDMRLLCKYKGTKLTGRVSKADMGGRILKYIQRGDFKSIFDTIGELHTGIKNTSRDNKNTASTSASNKDIKNTDISILNAGSNPIIPIPISDPVKIIPGPVPVPVSAAVISVGDNSKWKHVDHRKYSSTGYFLFNI